MVASNQTGDAEMPVLCLVCGETICTRSYCCQVEVKVEEGDEPIKIGGITNHAQRWIKLLSVMAKREGRRREGEMEGGIYANMVGPI